MATPSWPRVAVDGGEPARLRTLPTVDWFPHLSPDGRRAAFVAYPPGTTAHPADVSFGICTVLTDVSQEASVVSRIFGGQGSLNVNRWHPNGERFAYVAYPVKHEGADDR